MTASLVEVDGATAIEVETDLRISGRLAQFGGPVLQPVAAALLEQFAANLEALLTVVR